MLWRHVVRASLTVFLVAVPVPGTAQEVSEAVLECLACHEDPDLTMVLGDGTELSLHVPIDTFLGSVHGTTLVCADCHVAYDTDHPWESDYADHRNYVLQAYELCKSCHFDTYTRSLESVHYELFRDLPEVAPVCTDCHGAHDTQDPREKQAMISRSCGSCHEDTLETYAASVHGRALVENGNSDVPGCADCHTSHQIQHPTSARFHVGSAQICIDCHADEERMARYGLSAEVGPTYLTDFHGVTAALAMDAEEDPRLLVGTCIDCHGHHQVVSPREVGQEAMKARVAAACERCHEGASPDFPDAWLAHYRPSWEHAPLVYAVNLLYKIFIPFVVVGLVLQVGLHLYRVALRR